ncbi:protein of unknown function [Methylorubrum extorquens DM4]|uniref:Uncharacterized protein n=1 Tax=Methylorubrum extorquens (strain DSM 6343 / CIP 106787 / DM4) TaxID=661410 RepID=C7CFD5_METED|nr:hypothetical protein [Methylorubrum extorquens]CAX26069.1 protein of unknown function [Methylorubrum extorquens DM4]
MLKTIASILGLTPAPRPQRPPSAQRVAPAARPSVAPIAPLDAAAARRNDLREKALAMRPDPNARFAADVALVTRSFDPHSTQPSAEELYLAMSRLADLGQYVRAVYVAGRRVAVLPISQQGDRARTLAYRNHLTRQAETDLTTWEDGLSAIDRARSMALRTGDRLPDLLGVPEVVEARLAALREERAKRLADQIARRHGGGNGGGTGGGAGPAGSAPPAAPPAGPQRFLETDEDPENGSGGPKR